MCERLGLLGGCECGCVRDWGCDKVGMRLQRDKTDCL